MKTTIDFDRVWYATPARARSWSKWLVYDDVGTVSLNDGYLSFRGTHTQVEPRRVTAVILTRQRPNLVTYFFVCLLALPVYLPIAYVAKLMFHVSALSVLLVCYSIVPIGLFLGFSTKWVRATFSSEFGEPSEGYFADAGSQGWRGILGGTANMFRIIHAQTFVLPSD